MIDMWNCRNVGNLIMCFVYTVQEMEYMAMRGCTDSLTFLCAFATVLLVTRFKRGIVSIRLENTDRSSVSTITTFRACLYLIGRRR